ncbi:MAG TPA: HAD-IA family hydrolase [Candidatus Binataceae bacterium]|nr:HAD-IA family hydrolase [Candidatus Binataceae bacterium]
MLRVVFFDAAGTLFHTREPAGLSYAKIARRFGLEADDRLVIDSFRRAFATAPALAFGPGHEAAELRRLEREWWRRLVKATFAGIGDFADFEAYFDALFAFFADPANWICDPHAPVLLAALRESGLELGVISNFDYRIYAILEALELSRHFDSITISSEAGYAKPAPEIFRIALECHSSPAERALHVGDSEALDVAGARAAGIAAVLVDPSAVGPDAVGSDGAKPEVSGPAQWRERSCSEDRCVRVRSLGEVAAALGRLGFP